MVYSTIQGMFHEHIKRLFISTASKIDNEYRYEIIGNLVYYYACFIIVSGISAWIIRAVSKTIIPKIVELLPSLDNFYSFLFETLKRLIIFFGFYINLLFKSKGKKISI